MADAREPLLTEAEEGEVKEELEQRQRPSKRQRGGVGKMNFGGTVRLNKSGLIAIAASASLVMLIYYSRGGADENENFKPQSQSLENDGIVSLKTLLTASIESAIRGGDVVKHFREVADFHEKSKGQTLEGANDPVTDGDMKSHLAMYHSLKKSFPHVEIVSEEHESRVADVTNIAPAGVHENPEVESVVSQDISVPVNEVTIWIDPLDATQEYTEKLLNYVTTMVCVAVNGVPTIGVIHQPFEGFTAWGWVGQGISPKLTVSPKDASSSQSTKIIVSRSHAGEVKEVATKAFGENLEVIPAGGAGFKTLEVIKGNADAYVHTTLIKKWDICAGNAILNAVSGKMTKLDGADILYGNGEEYKVDGGLLATMKDHSTFREKLEAIRNR